MNRNIILCADGTGNKGGYTKDSNVFKTYNAVDIKANENSQITFYDNGVGTSANKFWKAISGALGFGFQHNVCELYTFLSKNYQFARKESDKEYDDDKVFIFGFSRGAATIRAFNGFLHDCGLIDRNSYDNEEELRREVKKLIKTYLRAKYCEDGKMLDKLASGKPVKGCPSIRKKIKVEFIGVWDTVAALGMPKRTDRTGLASILINWAFNRIDDLFNFFIHHRCYKFGLSPNVSRACHALSIDDARTSFWPRIWNETDKALANVKVDQVWFAGMHSDVGGGYPRQDMSNVSLLWILEQAVSRGLRLNEHALCAIKDRANVHDKIHDSRDGFGMFYRYHPRDIEYLCQDENTQQFKFLGMGENKDGQKLVQSIKIHESVLSRMYHHTAGYAPVYLPPKFVAVDNNGSEKKSFDLEKRPCWKQHRDLIKKAIKALKEIYIYQMAITLFIVSCVIYAWYCEVVYQPRSGFWGELADILQYFLPDMFNNAIELWINQQPFHVLPITAVIALWFLARQSMRISMRANALKLRSEVLGALKSSEEDSDKPTEEDSDKPTKIDTNALKSVQNKYRLAVLVQGVFFVAVICTLGYYFNGLYLIQ